MNVTLERLREVLSLDSRLGWITWNVRRGRSKAGTRAGVIDANGYRRVTVDYQTLLEHRAIWALHYGDFPCSLIDHVNGDRADNRICNLRLADQFQNGQNSNHAVGKSGYIGVNWNLEKQFWFAVITVRGRRLYLGSSKDIRRALELRKAAEKKYFGEFAYDDAKRALAGWSVETREAAR